MVEKLAFVGDIHGDNLRLSALLAKLDRRKLVFLGDYVDRGPNSREVIQILLEMAKCGEDPVFLSGNHEIGLLAYLSGKLSFLEYAWMGGVYTIRSYIGKAIFDVRAELAAAMPRSHYEFLSACKPCFETDEFVACHAGISPVHSESRELADIALGRHPSLFHDNPRLGKLVICGHYLQSSLTPFVSSSVVCLNTGCGTIEGPVTALLYPEMTFLQA
jgi:serine/threonine protein phosphatase 1